MKEERWLPRKLESRSRNFQEQEERKTDGGLRAEGRGQGGDLARAGTKAWNTSLPNTPSRQEWVGGPPGCSQAWA